MNEGEYKVMGLAPYGKPIYAERILSEIITGNVDGSFVLNRKYFQYEYSDSMVRANLFQAFF